MCGIYGLGRISSGCNICQFSLLLDSVAPDSELPCEEKLRIFAADSNLGLPFLLIRASGSVGHLLRRYPIDTYCREAALLHISECQQHFAR